jgi:hypothetical protein
VIGCDGGHGGRLNNRPAGENLRGSWFRETRGGPAPPDKNLRGSWFRETRA